LADLLDTDVWVALGVATHPHHARAKHYWHMQAGKERAFCRVTWLALPRLLSESRVFGEAALDGRAAWRVLEQWMNMPHVSLVREPPGVDELIGHWVTSVDMRGGDWTDAYLAAFAAADGHRLVTFDGGFGRFPGLSWLHLKP
jgi:toxin-antitoxin system PIN domain toxin